jgi:hypothetical protein
MGVSGNKDLYSKAIRVFKAHNTLAILANNKLVHSPAMHALEALILLRTLASNYAEPLPN